MPLITIKVFKDELNVDQSEELIAKITDVVTEVISEKLRDATWVIIEEVKGHHWGVAGKSLSLNDVKKMMTSD